MNIRFAKIFNWTPVAVERPVPFYQDYEDAGHMLIRYDVKVTYLYHGDYIFSFGVEENKLGLVPRRKALKKAVDFYRKVSLKIEKGNQR